MPAHRTQNSRNLRVEANTAVGAPQLNIISPTPQTFVFRSGASRLANSEAQNPFSFPEASRSLPNLFTTFHVGDYNPQSPPEDCSQPSSMFSPSSLGDSPVSGASTSSFFASPASSVYSSSAGSRSCSPSPSPSNEGKHHHRCRSTSSTSAAAPYPIPQQLEPRSNGQARTQPPRPPNPWICYRNWRSQQYKEQNYPDFFKGDGRGRSAPSTPSTGILGLEGDGGRRPRQADLSKHISVEWKRLSEEERAPFIRMSEEAKIKHARLYPGYKYQPRRKVDASPGKKTTSADKKSTSSPSSSPSKRSSSKSKSATKVTLLKDEDEELCELKLVNPAAFNFPSFSNPMLPQSSSQQGHEFQMTQDDASPFDMQVQENNSASAAECSNNGTSTMPPQMGVQVEITEGGNPEQDWTWLPDETLIPVSWEPEHEVPDGVLVDMSIKNGSNVKVPVNNCGADDNEEEEMEFKKPLYLSFNAFMSAQQESNNLHRPQPYCAAINDEPDLDHSLFNMNFDWGVGSSGFHFEAFGDMVSMDELSDGEQQRRDSVGSLDSYEGSPDTNSLFSPLTDGIDSLGFVTQDMLLAGTTAALGALPSFNKGPSDTASATGTPSPSSGRSTTPSLRIDTTNIPTFRPLASPRRASISSETVYKSPDGMLCPPGAVMGHRRSKTLGTRSAFPVLTGGEFRSIATETFGSNSGVMTSVLIPTNATTTTTGATTTTTKEGKCLDAVFDKKMTQQQRGGPSLEGLEDYVSRLADVVPTDGLRRSSVSSSSSSSFLPKKNLNAVSKALKNAALAPAHDIVDGGANDECMTGAANAELEDFEMEFGKYISMDPSGNNHARPISA